GGGVAAWRLTRNVAFGPRPRGGVPGNVSFRRVASNRFPINGADFGVGFAKIWHTGAMSTSSAKPRLVPCHFTVEDLQLIEWSGREKGQRARNAPKGDPTP